MNDMEERINKRLDTLSLPDFAKFMAEFKKAQTYIGELKRQPMQPIFDLDFYISDEDKDLVDLMGNPLTYKGKQVDESVDKNTDRKDVKRIKRKAMTHQKNEKKEI